MMNGSGQTPPVTTRALVLSDVVLIDPDRLGGAPVFRGTRVPIENLFDYLRAGRSIDVFLDHFIGVTREQVLTILDHAAADLRRDLRAA